MDGQGSDHGRRGEGPSCGGDRGRFGRAGTAAAVVLGTLSLLFVVAGCGGGDDSGGGPIPGSPEEAGEVVVRVTGDEGTAYAGDYGTLVGEPTGVEETLGSSPTEYEVELEGGESNGVSAYFEKTQAGTGELKAEVLADGEVVSDASTRAEFGSVVVDWLPPGVGVEVEDEEAAEGA